MKRQTAQRLDELLLERGYFADIKVAQGYIMAGKVVCDGKVVTKPGQAVKRSVDIFVRGQQLRYASRGGYKLERALREFQISVAGCVVLDVGASTGGFTDCLLQGGGSRVYAVDVGYGQLRGKLAADDRVVVMERTNISDLRAETFEPPIDLATVDLSYLSLKLAVPILARCFVKPVRMICLVKPLYEGLPQGRMSDPEALGDTLTHLFNALQGRGHLVRNVCVSPLLGGRGAVEFLIYLDHDAKPGLPAATLSKLALASLHSSPPLPPEELDSLA